MGIDSHGNNGHSHSHTGCFPFLTIPIPNFVTKSHYHGNPMGFPFPLGIPFPWSSLVGFFIAFTLLTHYRVLAGGRASSVVKGHAGDNTNICALRFQISEKWANLPLPLKIQKLEMFQLQGASPPFDSLTRGCALGPRWRLCPRPNL